PLAGLAALLGHVPPKPSFTSGLRPCGSSRDSRHLQRWSRERICTASYCNVTQR
ncbi:15523_t:CDS:2, partial [Acaulospora colombiana]